MALETVSAGSASSAEPTGAPRVPEEDAVRDDATVTAALDLLAHWWSRPLADEVQVWVEAGEVEAELRLRISGEPASSRLPVGPDDVLPLLSEYERLFVGPGHVPSPPYESYWREDAPVDIRRSLVGPCTAELRRLYRQLDIELAQESGELPDHIAVELEALAYALSFEETLPVARALFFDHVRQWLPRLCRAVAHESEQPFYRELAAVTLEWIGYAQRYFEAHDAVSPETS